LIRYGSGGSHDTFKKALDILELAYEQIKDCDRIYSALKFDIRKNSKNRLEGKIKSVEKKIGKVNT